LPLILELAFSRVSFFRRIELGLSIGFSLIIEDFLELILEEIYEVFCELFFFNGISLIFDLLGDKIDFLSIDLDIV